MQVARSMELIDTMNGGVFELQYTFDGRVGSDDVDHMDKNSTLHLVVYTNNSFATHVHSVRLVTAPQMNGNMFDDGGGDWPVLSDQRKNMNVRRVHTTRAGEHELILTNMPLSYYFGGRAMQLEVTMKYHVSSTIKLFTSPFKVVHMK